MSNQKRYYHFFLLQNETRPSILCLCFSCFHFEERLRQADIIGACCIGFDPKYKKKKMLSMVIALLSHYSTVFMLLTLCLSTGGVCVGGHWYIQLNFLAFTSRFSERMLTMCLIKGND